MDQQIIFRPDNRSIGLNTTGDVERIHRELGPTYNIGPYRIMAKIVKDGGPVGLGYGVRSLVKCRRVVVISMLPVTKDCVTLILS